MTLEYIKGFLKVDFSEDDEYIMLLLAVAEEYIAAAIGCCDFAKARVKLLALVIVTELYEKRSFSVEKAGEKAQFTIRSIINQLQAEEVIDDAD